MSTSHRSPGARVTARGVVSRAVVLLAAGLVGPALLSTQGLPPALLSEAWASKREPDLADHRDEAAASGDPGLALAYDDAILGFGGFHPKAKLEELHANRRADFAGFVQAEIDKLGPLTDSNADQAFGALLSLMAEARKGDEQRVADLAPVLTETLQPQMDQAAALMWARFEGLMSSHAYVDAVQLGAAVAGAVPGNVEFSRRLGEARAEAAEHYASLGRSEPSASPGAALVDARMAALFGGSGPDALTMQTAAVAALADVAWETGVSGSCGDLAQHLAIEFNKDHPGQPTRLSVRFDQCSIEPHASTTTESTDYTVVEHHTETRTVNHPGEECEDVQVNVGSDCVEEGGTTTCTPDYVTEHNCTDTSYTTEESFDVAEEHTYTESYEVGHRSATASASGSFRVDWEGGTQEVPFSLAAESGDDRQYTSEHAGSRSFDYGSEGAAYSGLDGRLGAEIRGVETAVQAARAVIVLEQAHAAVAAGQDAEAAHLFWVAARETGVIDPEIQTWGQAHYAVPADVFAAALAGGPLPARAFADAGVKLPEVDPSHVMAAETKRWEGDKQWELRQRLMATAGIGVSTARQPGDPAWQVNGPLINAAATVFTSEKGMSWALLARLAYGNNFSGSRISDGDLGAGIGLNAVGISLMPFIGVGYGNMVGVLPVPSAPQVEYGLRLGFAPPAPLAVDLTYTKTGRGSKLVSEEERLDLRVVYVPVSLTLRYSSYLSPQDKIYQFFTGANRVGAAVWIVAGVGI